MNLDDIIRGTIDAAQIVGKAVEEAIPDAATHNHMYERWVDAAIVLDHLVEEGDDPTGTSGQFLRCVVELFGTDVESFRYDE